MKKMYVAMLLVFLLTACACPGPSTPTDVPSSTVAPTAVVQPTGIPQPESPQSPMSPQPTPGESSIAPRPTLVPIGPVEYRLTFEATWSAETHPTDFPPNPHFSGLIGAAHAAGVRLWEMGELASPGIKNMAETGGKSPLDAEIDALIDAENACAAISGEGINPSPGEVSIVFTVNRDCPVVSVVSMIAPSPDWFVGVSALSLFEQGAWVDEKVIALVPYDAGTDSGAGYTSPNLPTGDPEAIFAIETDPLLVNGEVIPLGTFTFTRLEGE